MTTRATSDTHGRQNGEIFKQKHETRHEPNNVWSDLKHLRAHEHDELSNPWSEL